MFGFGKKKKKQQKEDEIQARMHVIPNIFYGGNDPVIYHDKNTTSDVATKKKKNTKTPLKKSWIATHKRKFFIIVGSIVILSVVGAASWYYVWKAIQPEGVKFEPEIVEPEPEEPVVEEKPDLVEEQKIVTTTVLVEEEEEPVDIDTGIDPVSFPRILLVDSPDGDSDELTDEEEIVFSTNLDVWDSDGDGYYDGQEVINLYNPNGFSPVKIIDSGLVAEYTNPAWKFRLYYPQSWQMGEVDTEFRQVLFSTLSGDFIEVRVFDREPGASFQEWFAANIAGEKFQDLSFVTNRFKEEGWRRKDGLVGYYLSKTHGTVLIYHPGITGAVPYRNVMRMMFESFRPTKNTIDIVDQVVLPVPPTFEEFVSSSTSTLEILVPTTTDSI
jgi:hypothetical protein